MPKFHDRFSNEVASNFSKNHNDRGSSPNRQEGRNIDPPKDTLTCGKFCTEHVGECLVGTNSF